MKKPLLIFLLFSSASLRSQPGDVLGSKGPKEFTVADCFKKMNLSGKIRADSLAASHILKGTRIWRVISLENSQNGVIFNNSHPCVEVSLFEIIKFGLLEKKLNAFSSDNFNEAALFRLSREQLIHLLLLHDSSEVLSFDTDGNSRVEKIRVNRYLLGSDIKGYLVKEDWILNSYSGKTEKYTIGLAPLIYDTQQDKIRPLFWLYYPEWEELLSLFEAKNFYSYERISFKDVFAKKCFVSMVSKESNVFDRSVKAYNHGEAAFMESERIKEKLNNSEQDLFQY